MNIEKMRKEFDLWFINNAPQCASLALSGDKVRIAMRELAWFSWQASRQSLVIDLPSDQCIDVHGYSPKATKLYCRKAIEAAGITVEVKS